MALKVDIKAFERLLKDVMVKNSAMVTEHENNRTGFNRYFKDEKPSTALAEILVEKNIAEDSESICDTRARLNFICYRKYLQQRTSKFLCEGQLDDALSLSTISENSNDCDSLLEEPKEVLYKDDPMLDSDDTMLELPQIQFSPDKKDFHEDEIGTNEYSEQVLTKGLEEKNILTKSRHRQFFTKARPSDKDQVAEKDSAKKEKVYYKIEELKIFKNFRASEKLPNDWKLICVKAPYIVTSSGHLKFAT